MRSSRLLAASALLYCFFALAPAKAQNAQLLSVLHSKNKQVEGAILKGDLSPVREIFAPGAMIVNPVGGLVGFDDFHSLLKSGALKYTAIETSEEKLTEIGPVAVLIYLATEAGTMQGHDIAGKTRRMEVWAQQSGQWKIVAVQSTPVIAQSQ